MEHLESDCSDGYDDDGDTLIDCDDPDCDFDAACFESDCTDTIIDNDVDGVVDCDDTDCSSDAACGGEIFDNNQDEDNDGLLDCDDPDCAMDPVCMESVCTDGVDNNGDNLIDCDDPDCSSNLCCSFSWADWVLNVIVQMELIMMEMVLLIVRTPPVLF